MNIENAEFEFTNFNFIYGQPASGKSAVFEAISLCLSNRKRSNTYGAYVMQGYKYASIKMKALLDGFEADFDVQLNKVEGIPFSALLMYRDQTYRNTKLQDFLKSKNIDYYANVMFAMQQERDITELTPSLRLYFMQNLFNFSFSEELHELNELIASNKSSLNKLLAEKTANESLKRVFSEQTAIDFKLLSNDEKTSLNDEIAKLNLELTEAIENDNKKKKLNDLLLNLEKQKLAVTTSIDRMQSEKARKTKFEQDSKDYTQKIDALQQDAAKLSISKQALEEQITELQKTQDELDKSIQDSSEKIKHILIEQAKNNAKIALIKKGFCPECGQRTDHIDDKAYDTAKVIESNLKDEQSILNGLKTRNNNAKSQINASTSKLSQIAQDINKCNSKIESFKMMLTSQVFKFDEKELNAQELKLQDIKQQILKVSNDISSIQAIDSMKVYHSIELLKEQLSSNKALEEKAKNIEAQNAKNKIELEKLDKAQALIDAQIVDLNKNQLAYNEATEVLSKLLPQYMSLAICDQLQIRINEFIRTIFPSYFVKVEISKKGCEMFYTKDKKAQNEKLNKWLSIEMSSGFEKAVLNLAFKTALAEFYNIDLFVGDEIDKAASDEDSIKLIELIWSLQNYQQIFIISHNSVLKNYISDNIEGSVLYEAKLGKFTKSN